ncbi:MAG: ComF family protein [Desulfobacterales bacterium]|nr:ComF family protein [Desulfobacterales bacterium]
MKKFVGFKAVWERIKKGLNDAFFPPACLVCGGYYDRSRNHDLSREDFKDKFFDAYGNSKIFSHSTGYFLCPGCSGSFQPVKSPKCSKCGVMFKSRQGDDHVCGMCITDPGMFRIARASGIYDEEFKTAIHRYKYNGKIQLRKSFGILLFSTFIQHWDTRDIDIVAPVPLHIKRLRKRGFNQAYLIIRDWKRIAEALNIDLSCLQAEWEVIVRNRWTDPQVGLKRKERIENIKGAFSVPDFSKIKGKRILIVDDVYTTGATANECSKILLAGGAEYVDVLTLARTM